MTQQAEPASEEPGARDAAVPDDETANQDDPATNEFLPATELLATGGKFLRTGFTKWTDADRRLLIITVLGGVASTSSRSLSWHLRYSLPVP